MLRRTVLILAIGAVAAAPAQSPIWIDLLSPGDTGFDGIPGHIRCVDVFVDLNQDHNDVWTAAGIRALTVDLGNPGSEQDGRIAYFDGDPNVAGVQPGLLNPGFANRFTTSLSRPRLRDSVARFENAGAGVAGRFQPTGPDPTTLESELNVAYFTSPPATFGSPSVDGFIARLSVDVSAVAEAGVDLTDYAFWGASTLETAPAGATFVLRSEPPPGGVYQGTIFSSFDDWWQIYPGINWGLWYVPEPASLVLIVVAGVILRGSRRTSQAEDLARE